MSRHRGFLKNILYSLSSQFSPPPCSFSYQLFLLKNRNSGVWNLRIAFSPCWSIFFSVLHIPDTDNWTWDRLRHRFYPFCSGRNTALPHPTPSMMSTPKLWRLWISCLHVSSDLAHLLHPRILRQTTLSFSGKPRVTTRVPGQKREADIREDVDDESRGRELGGRKPRYMAVSINWKRETNRCPSQGSRRREYCLPHWVLAPRWLWPQEL